MLWRGGRRSSNIEDRRGFGGGGFGGGGRMVGGGLGVIVIVVVGLLFGVDPMTLLSQLEGGGGSMGGYEQPAGTQGVPEKDERAQFVSAVLADTEDTWGAIFREKGGTYQEPRLVLFSGRVNSACGLAGAAMGPFYCPGDSRVYIDLSFYDEMKQRFRAPGDFAQAYVIAHEVAHHVQNVTGGFRKMEAARGRATKAEQNRLSVRMELQADCYAGVWGHHAGAMNQLEPGDVAEALAAATAIGDDRLQKQTQGRVVPESFTHGTSEQRMRWFKRGLDSGDPQRCDTFSAASL
jgi:uncharacterized protein